MHHSVRFIGLAAILAGLALSSASAAVSWRRVDSSPQGILPPPFAEVEPTAALAFDADKDGDADFVVAGRRAAPAIALWRHDAGRWAREVIDPDALRIEAGGAVYDIDGDGDLDIVFGGDNQSGEIWWWENPHPSMGRWSRHVIKKDSPTKHHDQIFGDFDGDGRTDFVSWNQNARKLLFYKIPSDPKATTPWTATTIFQWGAPAQYEGLARADVNGDGVDDIVGGGRWFRHVGDGKFLSETVDPDPLMTFTRAAAGQLVAGGRPELVFVPGDADGPLKWYEWKNDRWIAHILESNVIHGHSLEIADIDGDGHLDIFVAEMGQWSLQVNNPHARVMIFYGDGHGNFKKQTVSVGQGVHEARVADLDGDGRLDILGKPFRHHSPKLVIWLNQGPLSPPLSLNRWQRHLIDGPLARPARRLLVDAADLDGDGHPDLVTGDAWFRNPGRIGAKWEKRAVGPNFGNFAVAYDFDGDGSIDLLGTQSPFRGAKFALALNDGKGGFTVRTDLPEANGDFLQGAVAGRLADRQTLIALSWHKSAHLESFSYPSLQPHGPWTLGVLSPTTLNEQLSLGDIDGDGFADLLLGTTWLRNDGKGWTPHTLGSVADAGEKATPDRNRLADVNGDGRLDAVVALENGTQVFWFEQPANTPTGPWTRHLIGDVAGQGFSMEVADFDGDGDVDVIVGEHRNPTKINRVILFENLDGRGGSWRQHVVDDGQPGGIDHHCGTLAVDLDGDGDLDLVSIGWDNSSVWVIENKARTGRVK